MTPHYTQKRHADGSVYRISYYRCTKTMHFNNQACRIKHMNADHVERMVVQQLADLSQNDAYLDMSVEELNRDLTRKLEPLESEARPLRKRIDEIELEIGRYVKALGLGKISVGRLEKEISRLEGDKEALQKQYDELQRRINEEAVRDYNAEVVKRNLQDFRKVFSALAPKEQAEALQCILKDVIAYPDKLALEVFELAEFTPGSQNRNGWLPKADESGHWTQVLPLTSAK
jgi:chaperonin cofactor prefoldin